MERYKKLETAVYSLYAEKQDTRSAWADWMVANHVPVVVANAERLAHERGANVDLAMTAAVLHDIADIRMERTNENHESESLTIARTLMEEHGYSDEEITTVVDDAITYHGCHDKKPSSDIGLILATADAMAHLQSEFYIYAAWAFGQDRSLATYREWALKKLDRDIFKKVSYDNIREECMLDYVTLKTLIERIHA